MSSNMSLGVASYKITAEQLNSIKISASSSQNLGLMADDAKNMMFSCSNNTWGMIGDPYCPNCGNMMWSGGCTCGTAVPWNPAPVPMPAYPTYPPNVIGGGCYPSPSWDFGDKLNLITKGKGKADILGDFFGPDVNALVVLDDTDGGARFIPFMDKLNMIWLQETLNSWAAYDRDGFFAFVNSEDQTFFMGPKLNKEEVLKRMMMPEKAPEGKK